MIGLKEFVNLADRSNRENEIIMAQKLIYGWTQKLNITVALHRLPHEFVISSSVLVSIIDSTEGVSQLPSLVPLLLEMGADHSEISGDLVIGGETMLCLVDDYKFFTGFDEVWLFSGSPGSSKPKTVRLTSDIPVGQEPPDVLVRWMETSGCLAGLGDGDGLNFATFDPGLAGLWYE